MYMINQFAQIKHKVIIILYYNGPKLQPPCMISCSVPDISRLYIHQDIVDWLSKPCVRVI